MTEQTHRIWRLYAARQSEIRATAAQLTGRISKIAAAAKGLLKSYEETEG